MKLEGGCLCGKLRYRCTGEPEWVGHCHCNLCKRHSGAAFVTFVLFEGDNRVQWLGQAPAVQASPDGVERGFCPDCGSSISFARPGRNETSLFAGSLDNPDAVTPMLHIFTEGQCAWLEIDDGLPRHVRFPPHATDRDLEISNGISEPDN